MLLSLGSRAGALRRARPVDSLAMTFGLPDFLSFTRSSTALYTDKAGKLAVAPNDAARLDHTTTGALIGLLVEPTRTNKCTNFNATPSALSGLTGGGDAAAIVSVVSDSAALAAAGLSAVCSTGMAVCINNTAGTADAWVDIDGVTGNTNLHSLSAHVRGASGSNDGYLRFSGGTDILYFGTTTYKRYTLENQIPFSTTVKMRVAARAGKTVWFVLNQVEEGPYATSPIPVSGAAATRAQDRLTIASPALQEWFRAGAGYVALRYISRGKDTVKHQYLIHAHDGTTQNCCGLRIDTGHTLRGDIRKANVSKHGATNGDVQPLGFVSAGGMIWSQTGATIVSGGIPLFAAYQDGPLAPTALDVGARNAGADPFCGHLVTAEIGNQPLELGDLGRKLVRSTDLVIVSGGQSNMRGYFFSPGGNSDGGKQSFLSVLRTLEPDPLKQVVWACGATGGSAACRAAAIDDNWWYDTASGAFGPAWLAFAQSLAAVGYRGAAFTWDQGETDAHVLGATLTRAEYKAALLAIFTRARQLLGSVPVIIVPPGRRTVMDLAGGVQAVREIQRELATENSWIHIGPEKIDLSLYDQVHLSDAAYVTMGTRLARKVAKVLGYAVSGGVDGPRIVSASRSGTSVTVTVQHDGGTDFTPTTAIEGFKVFDGATEIPVSAAVRASATTLSLTLASAPVGPSVSLHYVYDALIGVDPARLVMDNASTPLPLRSASLVL